jgi:LmbE family N-acetylglucosaminyl deacetylase
MQVDIRKLYDMGTPVSLTEVAVPSSLRVVVLAPHPDDFDAMGVTLRRFRENGNTVVAAVARTCSGIEDTFLPGGSTAEKAELRDKEQRAGFSYFGLPEKNAVFLHVEWDRSGQVFDSPANQHMIDTFLAQAEPGIILLPHGSDTNSAHRSMHTMLERWTRQQNSTCYSAGRPPVSAGSIPRLIVLLCRDPKTTGMRMDLFTPFDERTAKWKARLLRFHDSQQQRNLSTRGYGFDERILRVNRAAAQELWIEAQYAEAFEVRMYG